MSDVTNAISQETTSYYFLLPSYRLVDQRRTASQKNDPGQARITDFGVDLCHMTQSPQVNLAQKYRIFLAPIPRDPTRTDG